MKAASNRSVIPFAVVLPVIAVHSQAVLGQAATFNYSPVIWLTASKTLEFAQELAV